MLTWRTVSPSAKLIMDPRRGAWAIIRIPLGRGALLLERLGPGSGGSYVGRADRRVSMCGSGGTAASALALPRGARSGCRSALLVNGRLAQHGSGPAEAVATRLTRMLSEPIATLGSEWHDCRPHLSRKRTPAPRPREPHAGERWALGGSVGKQRQLRSDQTTYGSASSDPCAPAAAIPEP